jgi:hypothetical protein
VRTEPEAALCSSYSGRESASGDSLLETPIEAAPKEVILPGARCHFRAAPPSRSAAGARTPRGSSLSDSTTCRSLGRVDSEPRAAGAEQHPELPVGESDPSRWHSSDGRRWPWPGVISSASAPASGGLAGGRRPPRHATGKFRLGVRINSRGHGGPRQSCACFTGLGGP